MDDGMKEAIRQYSEQRPKSVCYCGHSGDGANSNHAGPIGHGTCNACTCSKFTWKEWTDAFFRFLHGKA